MKVVFLLLAIATYVVAKPNVANFEITDERLASILKTKDDMIDFITERQIKTKKTVKVRSFSYKDCGGPGAMLAINSVAITPDPLAFPGPLNVAADITVKKNLDRPLKGDLVIYKKVLGKYVKLPCIDNFGSCTYDGLCDLLEQVQCPDPLVKIGIDCRCPFKMSNYKLPSTQFTIEASIIPTGDYHFIGNATVNGNEGACLDLVVTNNYKLPSTEFDIDASFLPTGDYHFIGNATVNGSEGASLDIVVTNTYKLPSTEFDVDVGFLPTGDYHFIGNATVNGNEGACLDLVVTVK